MVKIEISPKGYFQSINEFHLLHDIGVGSFGKVKLAQHRGTRRLYAIKIIDLTANLTSSEASLVLREIKMHSKLDHPHIIKLWDTLTDGHKIYMVMDYAQNGSLFSYHSDRLKKGRRPSPSQIYQFFYQTLQAVKYLHSLDIMHRDIKPENLLLDQNLNIKLCDFGWATNQITTPRFTFCGTYEYMAPEMVLEKSYNFNIDIWALGVLLFELVHGRAPFQADSLRLMKDRISIGSYEINTQCGDELKNLIIDILQFTPSKRLTIQQIQSHEWVLINQNTQIDSPLTQIDKSLKIEKKDQTHLTKNKNHFQSVDSFSKSPIISLQASFDPTGEKATKVAYKQSFKEMREFKKHKRNITQPVDTEQCRSFDKKMQVLLDILQTEANTPLPLELEMLQKPRHKLRKQTKKCKTQGEDEISQLLAKVRSSKKLNQFELSHQQGQKGEKKTHLRTETGPIIRQNGFVQSRNLSNSLLKEKSLYELEFKQGVKKKSDIAQKTKNKIQRIEDKLQEISSKLSPTKARMKLRAN